MGARFVPVIHGATHGRPDEADTIAVAADIARTLEQLGYASEIHHIGLDLGVLERLAVRRPHVVFNLVEAVRGEDALATLVPPVLDHLRLPYTGSSAEPSRLAMSKLATKELLRARSLPTADWWLHGKAVPRERRVIIKSVSNHASVGLDSGSVISGASATQEIVAREARFGGRFFAEAYVEGREFNVAVLEVDGAPRVLPVPEIEFVDWPGDRPRIVDYEAKWDEHSPYYHRSARRFGLDVREPDLARTLGRLAVECWNIFDLSGYARIDMRLDEAGEPFILEVNVNPCLARDAGFIMTAREAGLSFEDVLTQIIQSARRRCVDIVQQPREPSNDVVPGETWREHVRPEDIARVRALVDDTKYFSPAEIDIAAELVEERLSKGALSGYEFVILENGGAIQGYACYGLTPGTETTYDLYWIVVAPELQGKGHGRRILERTLARISAAGGVSVYVDTSSTERYAPTRAFYERNGFIKRTTLDDFYRPGDGKVIYEKRLTPAIERSQTLIDRDR